MQVILSAEHWLSNGSFIISHLTYSTNSEYDYMFNTVVGSCAVETGQNKFKSIIYSMFDSEK